jgi:TonB family protein
LHIKATYELLDDHGTVQETGGFDEFWVSPKKYKLTYSSSSFNQTDYSTERGLFRVGDRQWPGYAVTAAHNALFPSMPSSEVLSESKLRSEDRSVGSSTLRCVTVESSAAAPTSFKPSFCFESSSPMLRMVESSEGIDQIIYNDIASIHGSYFARGAAYFLAGKQRMQMHVDVLDALPQMDEASLLPPTNAVEIPRRVVAGTNIAGGKVIRNVKPDYPGVAMAARVQGTVVLDTVIGKIGRITFLKVISGPPMLQQPAMDCVRQWEYQPYSEDGEPIEVETRINVVFSLGGAPRP